MNVLANVPTSGLEVATEAGATIIEAEHRLARNLDVISAQEQSCLNAMRLLVAGCGSVGGAVVEPLVRLGIGAVVLADPERFDLTNINRQPCVMTDVGRPKASVLAERALAINPGLDVRVFDQGLREGNIAAALEGVDIAFDGVDAAMSPWEKYLLHAKACSARIPVIAGMDFGGKAVVYVFDYRRRNTPFYGRATEEAHRAGRLDECLKWIGYSHFPTDFLPVIANRMATGRPWPQVSYCVLAMGALGTRVVLDVMMGRDVPHVVAFDTHMAVRRPLRRIREYLRFPSALIATYRSVKRRDQARTQIVAERCGGGPVAAHLEADPMLKGVIEAFHSAPSPHNTQPWVLKLDGRRSIHVSWTPKRALPTVDPQGHAIAYALGCGIEAVSAIASFELEPGPTDDFADPRYTAGVLHIRQIRATDYAYQNALLRRRSTNRLPFLAVPLPADLPSRCATLAESVGAWAVVADPDRSHLKSLAFEGARRLFARADYVRELLDHVRFDDEEERRLPTGFTRETLAVSWPELKAMSALRARPAVRAVGAPLGLPRLFAAAGTTAFERCGGYVLVGTRNWTTAGRVDAGRALMRVWLELTRQKLACQPVDFPISYSEGRRTVLAMFGMDAAAYPIALLRVGRPLREPTARSPRLPLESICNVLDD